MLITLMMGLSVHASERFATGGDDKASIAEGGYVQLEIEPGTIFAGYGDTDSDVNRIEIADKLCQHFGYLEAGNYRIGFEPNLPEKKVKLLTVDKQGKPIRYDFYPDRQRMPNTYFEMDCLAQR